MWQPVPPSNMLAELCTVINPLLLLLPPLLLLCIVQLLQPVISA
jgi:hypothetical protein